MDILPLRPGLYIRGENLLWIEHAEDVDHTLEEVHPGVFITRTAFCTTPQYKQIPLHRISCIIEERLFRPTSRVIRLYDDCGRYWGNIWSQEPGFARSMAALETVFGPPYTTINGKGPGGSWRVLWIFSPQGYYPSLLPLSGDDIAIVFSNLGKQTPFIWTQGFAAWTGLTLQGRNNQLPVFIPWKSTEEQLRGWGVAQRDEAGALVTCCPVRAANLLLGEGALCQMDEGQGITALSAYNREACQMLDLLAQAAPPPFQASTPTSFFLKDPEKRELMLWGECSVSEDVTGIWELRVGVPTFYTSPQEPAYTRTGPLLEAEARVYSLPEGKLGLYPCEPYGYSADEIVCRALATLPRGMMWLNPDQKELCFARMPKGKEDEPVVLIMPVERIEEFVIERGVPARYDGYSQLDAVFTVSGRKTLLRGATTHDLDSLAAPIADLTGKRVVFTQYFSDA